MMGITTDRDDPRLTHGVDNERVAQAEVYLVLSDEERAKGFVKPYRTSYRHVGIPGPKYPLRDLTQEEGEACAKYNYVKFEVYPESESPVTGRYWTQKDLDLARTCGCVTTMGRVLAETFARDPYFYGGTFCIGCSMHRPLSEFVWEPDGEPMDPHDPGWRKP